MPHLDELDLALGPLQRPEHPVDAVAGKAVDPSHTPLMQALNDKIADGFGHDVRLLERDPCKPLRLHRWRAPKRRRGVSLLTEAGDRQFLSGCVPAVACAAICLCDPVPQRGG